MIYKIETGYANIGGAPGCFNFISAVVDSDSRKLDDAC